MHVERVAIRDDDLFAAVDAVLQSAERAAIDKLHAQTAKPDEKRRRLDDLLTQIGSSGRQQGQQAHLGQQLDRQQQQQRQQSRGANVKQRRLPSSICLAFQLSALCRQQPTQQQHMQWQSQTQQRQQQQHQQLQQKPLLLYRGAVYYACTPAEMGQAMQMLAWQRPRIIGLDVEWRALFKAGEVPRPTALMQLCYHVQGGVDAAPPPDGAGCMVMLLHIMHTGLSPDLQALLLDEDAKKCGVGIGNDACKIANDFQGLQVAGLVDLSAVANGRVLSSVEDVTANTECRRWSLAGLVEEVLHARLPKPPVRTGNWERRPLDPEQRRYAAGDAFASLALHWALRALPTRISLSQVARAAMLERTTRRQAASEGQQQDEERSQQQGEQLAPVGARVHEPQPSPAQPGCDGAAAD